jgi:hypothetical protein
MSSLGYLVYRYTRQSQHDPCSLVPTVETKSTIVILLHHVYTPQSQHDTYI